MSQPPLVPIDYRSPQATPPPPPEHTIRMFAVGLFGGIAISVLVWLPRWHLIVGNPGILSPAGPLSGVALWGVLALKIIGGLTFTFIRGYRGLGAGLATSLFVGVIIFVHAGCGK